MKYKCEILIAVFILITGECFAAGGGTQKFEIKPEQKKQVETIVEKTVETAVTKIVEEVVNQHVVPKLTPKAAPIQIPEIIQKKENMQISAIKFGKDEIPADYRSIKISGDAVVSREQAYAFARKNITKPKLQCSVKEIVDFYYDEAETEGIRPDLALCQAVVETGMFTFTGTVKPEQNNFCGLGTTGKGVKGAYFNTPVEGVRAHIQHLLAYCQKNKPKQKVIDPRYDLVHKIRLSKGFITNWYGLNGTWAMGAYYCEKIMTQYMAMLKTKI
ncbi:MAG: glucosaminidase domain-containing protein [Acidaminococcaceae bacterium]|nr:glucosaminidase domain-containing protein [Acidaminococcaceae bacterium]